MVGLRSNQRDRNYYQLKVVVLSSVHDFSIDVDESQLNAVNLSLCVGKIFGTSITAFEQEAMLGNAAEPNIIPAN